MKQDDKNLLKQSLTDGGNDVETIAQDCFIQTVRPVPSKETKVFIIFPPPSGM